MALAIAAAETLFAARRLARQALRYGEQVWRGHDFPLRAGDTEYAERWNSGRGAEMHEAGIVRHQSGALRKQSRGVAEAELPDVIKDVRRPVEGAAEVRGLVIEVRLRCRRARRAATGARGRRSRATLPGPIGFAAGVKSDGSRREIELAIGAGSEGRWQLVLPAEFTRDFGDAIWVAFLEPFGSVKDDFALGANLRLEGRAPVGEDRDLVVAGRRLRAATVAAGGAAEGLVDFR